jgi:hypothetical protein
LERSKLLDRKWHHFIISYASGSGILYCYHNGKLTMKDRGFAKSFIAKDGVLVIGAQQSRYNEVNEFIFQFTGEISQLQIYRRTFAHKVRYVCFLPGVQIFRGTSSDGLIYRPGLKARYAYVIRLNA